MCTLNRDKLNPLYSLAQMYLFGNYWEITTMKMWQVAPRWALNGWKLHQLMKASQVHKSSRVLEALKTSSAKMSLLSMKWSCVNVLYTFTQALSKSKYLNTFDRKHFFQIRLLFVLWIKLKLFLPFYSSKGKKNSLLLTMGWGYGFPLCTSMYWQKHSITYWYLIENKYCLFKKGDCVLKGICAFTVKAAIMLLMPL